MSISGSIFLLSSSKTPFGWGEGWGLIRDNRILVLVHSTKRESASLPRNRCDQRGISKVVPCIQKWQRGYCKMVENCQQFLTRSSVNGDTKKKKKKWCCRFCVTGHVAPELLSAFVNRGKKKKNNVDIRTRNTDDHFDRFLGEGLQVGHCESNSAVCYFAFFFLSRLTKIATAVQLYIDFYIAE